MNDYKSKYGYFRNNGSEYVITRPDTPRPWVNVICPNEYGTVISQAGGGYSWLTHAKMNRVTRWQQDLLTDRNGKYIFIRDSESKKIWSATWMPIKAEYTSYNCIHGMGYTVFENQTNDIESRLTVFVPPEDKLEIWKVEIINKSDRPRKLEVINYLEWCAGASDSIIHRELHDLFVETTVLEEKDILATKRVWSINRKNSQFFNHAWDYTAYLSGNPGPDKYCVDRRQFIGNYGDLKEPALKGFNEFTGEKNDRWNESIGSMLWNMELAPGESREIELIIGLEEDEKEISNKKTKYFNNTSKYLEDTKLHWNELLGKTYVETPDNAVNYMMNYWLKYQAISARISGRTGYYQAGGAFGYRDQLQDSQIYFKLMPEKARARILAHASRQFKDGAVQHWWHPITNTGLRNKISDNLLWLPFITYRYLMETLDYEVLNEKTPYLDEGEDTVRVHCEKAIERVWGRKSERGLPYIGEGDWNDGLSAVGHYGKGESVWLAHFLVGILKKWTELESHIGDNEKSAVYKNNASVLTDIINDIGWDGQWYFRATTDEGTVLGSKDAETGKIFLNAQTWSILNGIVPDERLESVQKAMESHLYREYGPVLFYPAYNKCDSSIGYLTRYAPGARENGGLYFHAACWAVAAECEMKRPDKVKYLLDSFLPPKRGMDPDHYCCEPYVLPGNVDGPDSPNFGKGGWTWYTGSASWLYTVGWDWIIGFKPVEEGFEILPCLPVEWNEVKGFRHFRDKKIEFVISNSGSGTVEVTANGQKLNDNILKIGDYKDSAEIKLEIKC